MTLVEHQQALPVDECFGVNRGAVVHRNQDGRPV